MSAFANSNSSSSNNNNNNNKDSEFESQRSELVREIALGMESVLQYINRLNRNMESIIAVGNEFSSVEALWSQFENVMAPEESGQQQQQQQQQGHGNDEDAKDEEGEEYEGQNDHDDRGADVKEEQSA